MGGVKKEFFHLFMKAYISENDVFEACDSSQSANKSNMLWFKRSMAYEDNKKANGSKMKKLKIEDERNFSSEFLIGVMLGLAFYHRILVSLPIPPHMYKLMKGLKVFFLISPNILYSADEFLLANDWRSLGC